LRRPRVQQPQHLRVVMFRSLAQRSDNIRFVPPKEVLAEPFGIGIEVESTHP
jgi:hypothetical protein